jgi:hypothetical protein
MGIRRGTRAGNTGEPRGFWERILFSFMGPPQLGDPTTPVRQPAHVELCPRCHRPYDEHEVVRRATHSYTRCPS